MPVSKRRRYTEVLAVRCPASFPPAVERAADQACTTPAEYTRRALLERLRKDGIDPAEERP
jgi:hypothetical protein